MESSLHIHTENENLLRATKKKLSSVVATIEQLKEEDFPHTDSKDALGALESVLKNLQQFISTIKPSNDPATVKRWCKEMGERLTVVLPLLGFIVRSTHVRNAFELHGPVLRLVHSALGANAKLILSSEWEFSPFTLLPPALENRRYVMIGMPASESENSLIVPLAGHELGHSIWAQQNLADKYKSKLQDVIVEKLRTSRFEEFKKHFGVTDQDQINDLIGRQFWDLSWGWATRQCEELFCDFVGVAIFGASYLYAFMYLLAPGLGKERSEIYPGISARAQALVRAAKVVDVVAPIDFVQCFEVDRDYDNDPMGFLLSLSDEATSSLIDELIHEAVLFCKDHKLTTSDADDVDKIAKAFSQLVPAFGAKSLSNIINAGWKVYLSGTEAWPDTYVQFKADPSLQETVLNDLILKTQ